MTPIFFVRIKIYNHYFWKKIWNLENIWMVSSKKWYLKAEKTRFILFHRCQYRDHQLLRLPALKVNDYEIKRYLQLNFLVEGHIIWIGHINTLENKLSNNFCLLYKSKPFLTLWLLKRGSVGPHLVCFCYFFHIC